LTVKKTYNAFDARGWKTNDGKDRRITLYVQGMHGSVQHDLSLAEVVELQELLAKAVAQSGEEPNSNPWSETPF
jgi:hypothetical protein